jgi:hypothetical protein
MEMHARKLAPSLTRELIVLPRKVELEEPRWSRAGQMVCAAMAGAVCWAVPLGILYFVAF